MLTFAALVFGYMTVAQDARAERVLVGREISDAPRALDVTVTFATYDDAAMTAHINDLLAAGVTEFHSQNCDNAPADACSLTATLAGEMELHYIEAPVIQQGSALVVATYTAQHPDILARSYESSTVIDGERQVMFADAGTFTLASVEHRSTLQAQNTQTQYALASIPVWLVWALALCAGAIVSALFVLIVPTRRSQYEVLIADEAMVFLKSLKLV